MLTAALLFLGLVMLVGGGAMLVRGASDIAKGFGISPVVVGLTVVAFGTSMPELVVNTLGASSGATDLAFGNVLGSNISNMALVLGLTALIAPITIHSNLVRREIPLLLLGSAVMTVMALDPQLTGTAAVISRSDALILFMLFLIFLYITVLDFVRERKQGDAILQELSDYPLVSSDAKDRWRWPLAIGGMVLLYVGGDMTVDSAMELARDLDISDTIIGLFVVAIGTSLPEMVTSIIAAMRRESDLALGNVVGSNIFNSMFVLPAGALVAPIAVPASGLLDLSLSLLLVFILIPVFFFRRTGVGRGFGTLLILLFVVYAVVRVFVLPG